MVQNVLVQLLAFPLTFDFLLSLSHSFFTAVNNFPVCRTWFSSLQYQFFSYMDWIQSKGERQAVHSFSAFSKTSHLPTVDE